MRDIFQTDSTLTWSDTNANSGESLELVGVTEIQDTDPPVVAGSKTSLIRGTDERRDSNPLKRSNADIDLIRSLNIDRGSTYFTRLLMLADRAPEM